MKFSKPFFEYGDKKFSKPEPYRGFWGKFDQSKNFPAISGKTIAHVFQF